MAAENPVWGEERIANVLLIKLGIRVSPRTVGSFGDSEFRIPTSIGGGCGRDHEIGVGRTPSRVFTSAGRRLIAMVSK
jgi:hypothetical protein